MVEDPPEGFMMVPPALAVPAAWRKGPGASPSVGVAETSRELGRYVGGGNGA